MNRKFKISFTFLDKGDKVWTRTFWSKRDMDYFIKKIKPYTNYIHEH